MLDAKSFFVGGTYRPTVVVNKYSTAGVTPDNISFTSGGVIKEVLTGAVTAGVLKTVLNITGSAGRLQFLSLVTASPVSRTLRIKLTLDGVVVFDSTSAATATSPYGIVAVGSAGANSAVLFQQLPFYTSLLVEIASSLTETDGTRVGYVYDLGQA